MSRSPVDMKQVLTAHLDLMFSYSLFITGNRDKALDLMQDTIASLLAKKGAYEERDAFRTWIFRVLKNNWLNRVAKDMASREVTEAAFRTEDDETIDFADPETGQATDPLLRERLLDAFAQLPPDQHEICYLVDIEGLSYDETAKRLAIPIGTVMSRLHRGREFLKTKLRREAAELRIVPFSAEVTDEKRKAM